MVLFSDIVLFVRGGPKGDPDLGEGPHCFGQQRQTEDLEVPPGSREKAEMAMPLPSMVLYHVMLYGTRSSLFYMYIYIYVYMCNFIYIYMQM